MSWPTNAVGSTGSTGDCVFNCVASNCKNKSLTPFVPLPVLFVLVLPVLPEGCGTGKLGVTIFGVMIMVLLLLKFGGACFTTRVLVGPAKHLATVLPRSEKR